MTKKTRILILEDQPTDAELEIRELRQAKLEFEAKCVETKESFLEALEEFDPDVIISDYGLPQFNGLEALRLLKELNLDIPFILCTGSLTEEVAVKCMKEGAADYVLKSSLKRLPSAVLNVLEKSEARQTKQEAVAALRESEEWLKALLDASRDGIVVEDDGEIVYINQSYARHLKYDEPEELIGRHIADILPPVEAERLSEFGQRRLRGENPLSVYQFTGLCKDGTTIEVEGAVSSYVIGGKKYVMTAVRDITERKLAAEALEKSERQYRFLSEGIMHQVWTAQPDGKLDYVNRRTLEYFGLTYEQMIIDGWLPVVHPDDTADCIKRWTKSLETGEYYEVEFRLKNADGTYRWHLARATAGHDPDEKIVKWFGTNTDIHDKKLAEEELIDARSRLEAALEAGTIATWSYDILNNRVFADKKLAQLYSVSPEDACGGAIENYIRGIHPDDRRRVEEELDGSFKNSHVYESEHRIVKSDGTMRSVIARGRIERDAAGTPIRMPGVVIDVTEQKRADDALRDSEYKMRTLLGNMNEGLLQVDTADSIEFVNNRFCGMLGYSSPDELIGKIWSQLTLDDDEREFIKAVNKRRRQGISDSYELQMRKKTGEKIWVLVGGAPMIDAEGITTGSMGVFTDITERKRAEEQMHHDAFHDSLTGLANRTLFMNHLHLTIERGKRRVDATFAVLFLDFDRFKVINDSLGHAEGDKLLMQIARRLESSLRPGDLVARLGGDEFTILLPELDDESDALRIAERIQEKLKGAFALAGREIFTSASIGIALSTAGHTQAEDMLRDADIAMYRAKAKGKAQFQVFDQEMHKDALAQMQLETEMRHALERGEFLLHYQPIINLETNNLMGFEALVRWKHPERGMVPPMEFIPAAEETGLILALGKWILNESCRQMRQWQIGNPAAESLTVSVNLSSKQFQQPNLAEQVAAALDAAGLDARCLKLEITESHIMENAESAIAMMNRLRNLGTEISLDDFGTGYSSLSYLHRFPVDYLKIDRSFVTRMVGNTENAEIVHTIIKLAQNLKMKVVAEGIETAEQLDKLQQLNCEYGQGYFFSKPLEAEAANLFIGSGIINSAPVSNLSPVNFKLIG